MHQELNSNTPTPRPNDPHRGARRSHRQKKKRIVIALNLAVLTVLAGGTAAYGAMSKTVTLDVDGKKDTVRTFGASVGSLLKSHDVKVDGAEVNAKPTATVTDGDTISVRYAKPVKITVDGKTTEKTLKASTVGDALKQLDIKPQAGAFVSAPASSTIPRSGADIIVSNPKDVTVAADGKKKTIRTAAPTVGQAVREAGVALGAIDSTSAGRSTFVKDDQKINVDRITLVSRTETVKTQPKVVYRNDANLERGTSKVIQPGSPGKAREKVVLFLADGKKKHRAVLSSQKLKSASTRVVVRGTKAPEVADDTKKTDATAPSVADGSVWDRLAQCESGGNWSINTGNGYYGGLQFSAATWHSVGGPGLPNENSREVQIKYAQILQARSGWGQWSCAAMIGLH